MSSESKFCGHCGERLPANAKFCGECGMSFAAPTASSQNEDSPQPQQQEKTPLNNISTWIKDNLGVFIILLILSTLVAGPFGLILFLLLIVLFVGAKKPLLSFLKARSEEN